MEKQEMSIEDVKKENEKYIEKCQEILKRTKKLLSSNKKYIQKHKYESYNEYLKKYKKYLDSCIELAHKESIYVRFYQARLEHFIMFYENREEDINEIEEEIHKGKMMKTINEESEKAIKMNTTNIW